MAMIHSAMMPLGMVAPDFALPDAASGEMVALKNIRGAKGTLVMFICNHCPFVKRIEEGLAQLGRDYAGGEIGIAAVSANDADNYPEDAPDKMKAAAERLGYAFPYLFDEAQETAKQYGATCTPDFFLFDAARPNNSTPATGEDIRRAMDLLLADKPVPAEGQTPSIGCSIKWK